MKNIEFACPHDWVVARCEPETTTGEHKGTATIGWTAEWIVVLVCPKCERRKSFVTQGEIW